MLGLAAATTTGELPTGSICDNFQYSQWGGGFVGGLKAWAMNLGSQGSSSNQAYLAAVDAAIAAGLPVPDDPGNYSISAIPANIGAHFSDLFDPNIWLCSPSYQIGVLVAPLALILVTGAILKRGRR